MDLSYTERPLIEEALAVVVLSQFVPSWLVAEELTSPIHTHKTSTTNLV